MLLVHNITVHYWKDMNFLSNLVNQVLVYYKPTLCKENVAFVKHQKIGKREYENKEKRVKKY